MGLKRKLRPGDHRVFEQVIENHGIEWTYKALAVWYRSGKFEELAKVKPWTDKNLSAFRFLFHLVQDYTSNVVYKAIDAISLDLAG